MSEINNVSDQTSHLESAISKVNSLTNEINTLSNELAMKRELALKVQGVVEYLTGIGVKLPENPKEINNTEGN